MFDKAAFEIVGRVGSIKTFDNMVRLSIASNASFKKDGKWEDRTRWNQVTIFDKATRKYVAENFDVGDYVRAVGTLGQSSYERNGETVYTTDLIVTELSRQPKKTAADTEQSEAA